MDGCMDGWMHRWMHGWMHEWMNGWMHGSTTATLLHVADVLAEDGDPTVEHLDGVVLRHQVL